MRYLLALAAIGATSLALGQGTPRVPAHFRNRSITTQRVITTSLYVDGGTTYGGEVAAQSYASSAGGEVYAPAGLSVDPGSFICLDEPTCNYRIYKSATQLVLNGAGQPIACIDGLQAQGVIEAGTLQPNSCEMAGGATACTVRAASGTGATANAKLLLQAGSPDGVVEVVNDDGLRTATIGHPAGSLLLISGQGAQYSAATLPACNAGTTGAVVRADIGGGAGPRLHFCDGAVWYPYPFGVPYNAAVVGGAQGVAAGKLIDASLPFGGYGGRVSGLAFTVQDPGTCAGSCLPGGLMKLTVSQGATALCTLSFDCLLAEGTHVSTLCAGLYEPVGLVALSVDPTTTCDKRPKGTATLLVIPRAVPPP